MRCRLSLTASCCEKTIRLSRKVVDDAMIAIYKGGEINKIYDKWFLHRSRPRA